MKSAQPLEPAEQLKASGSARIEQPLHLMNNLLGRKNVRYKGLAKNEAQLFRLALTTPPFQRMRINTKKQTNKR